MTGNADDEILLLCDVKTPAASVRLLTFELHRRSGGTSQLVDSLIIPEDPEASFDPANSGRFFSKLAIGRGYSFVGEETVSSNAEWQRALAYLESAGLCDLRQLSVVFFPTLPAVTVDEYLQAFRPRDVDGSQMQTASKVTVSKGGVSFTAGQQEHLSVVPDLWRVIDAVRWKAVSLPRGTRRLLRVLFRALPKQYSRWLEGVMSSAVTEAPTLNANYFVTLDRFENLTAGNDVAPDQIVELFRGTSTQSEYIDSFEERRGQARYVEAVLSNLTDESTALLEAATGTGKSLAYLIPTIAVCAAQDKRGLIVTRTRSLQEQLFRSDLRKIRRLIPNGFRVSLLKGLANYLCLLRYRLLLSEPEDIVDTVDARQLSALIIWELDTKSGDFTETGIFDQPDSERLLRKIVIDEGSCLGRNCQFYNDCYAFRARREASKAGLVVTNYALLFSDIAAGGEVLGRFAHVIFDEAHRIENEAINAFSKSVALLSLGRWLQRIGGEKFLTFWSDIASEETALPVDPTALQEQIRDLSIHLRSLAVDLRDRFLSSGKGFGERIRFVVGDDRHTELARFWKARASGINEIQVLLTELRKFAPSESSESQLEGAVSIRRTASSMLSQLTSLEALAADDSKPTVRWGVCLENGEVHLTVTPLQIGDLLAETLYPKFRSLLFTSATLDSEDDFAWISRSLGVTAGKRKARHQIKIPSPFPLKEQLRVVLARFLPPPTYSEYDNRLASLILKLRSQAKLPTLVLCTSYRMIDGLGALLSADKNLRPDLLIQTPETIPQILLNKFRQMRSPLLLGAESFWEGIDLPGKLLRLLFVTRLPFPVPEDPLEQARLELAERRGESPFMSVSVPMAVLKFRQGIGRMIRSADDWGAVVITDSRMGRKPYGKLFYSASPVDVETFDHESLLLQGVSSWLKRMSDVQAVPGNATT